MTSPQWTGQNWAGGKFVGIYAEFDRWSQEAGWCLAVSGGPDSVALMHLVAEWAISCSRIGKPVPAITVATVDHGLRAEAAAEAQLVADWAASLGFEHTTLRLPPLSTSANLQEAARRGRYKLLQEHCLRVGAGMLVTAHTRDDQAETLLLRLARGSGVDGLAAMQHARPLGPLRDIMLVRPLLDTPKQTLASYLQVRGVTAVNDPSNNDDRFDRVRFRQAMPKLAELGIDAHRLVGTARQMRRAADALEAITDDWLIAHAASLTDFAVVSLPCSCFLAAQDEIKLRILRRVIQHLRPREHPPRLSILEELLLCATDWCRHPNTTRRKTACGVIMEDNHDLLSFCIETGRAGYPVSHLEASAQADGAIYDERLRVFVVRGPHHLFTNQSNVALQATGAVVDLSPLVAKAVENEPGLGALSPDMRRRAVAALPVLCVGNEPIVWPTHLADMGGLRTHAELRLEPITPLVPSASKIGP